MFHSDRVFDNEVLIRQHPWENINIIIGTVQESELQMILLEWRTSDEAGSMAVVDVILAMVHDNDLLQAILTIHQASYGIHHFLSHLLPTQFGLSFITDDASERFKRKDISIGSAKIN